MYTLQLLTSISNYVLQPIVYSELETSNIDLETSTINLYLETSNIDLDLETCDIDPTTSNINIDVETCNVDLTTSNINLDLETSNIDLETSNIKLATSNINLTTSDIDLDLITSNIDLDLASNTNFCNHEDIIFPMFEPIIRNLQLLTSILQLITSLWILRPITSL